ncbi:MAG TPA: choice-of-anchor L domain-containing protein [Bacteroidales bacterium]|nr:choice-of-anchor L domain-containing protein [Bacteroidales bacterium]HRX96362.1 choice-of-anchor L domain-containing protein [Bacteroidales bacterium]
MKTPISLVPIIVAFFLNFSFSEISAQITINSGSQVSPESLVYKIVGPGIVYDNITFQGAAHARGTFANGDSTILGINNGIFLTSGIGSNLPGPNNSCSASANNGMPGHPSLNAITTSTTYDAAVLEFDFIPNGDTLVVNYVFGSEEYNDWTTPFSDVIGIFITGPNPAGGYYSDKNIGIVPGTVNMPVNCNTINNGSAPCGVVPTGPCTNCQYFQDNSNGLTLQFDGLTTVLTAFILVVPLETYHVKLGVADAGDGVVDSGIFIEEGSFRVTNPPLSTEFNLDPPGLTENMVEGHVNANIIFRLAEPFGTNVTLDLEIGGTAVNGIDYEWINDNIVFEAGVDSAVITIAPYFDQITEGGETVWILPGTLNGLFFGIDTISLIIEDYIELVDIISPPTITCQGCEVDLWVQVFNGYPPYSYYWEPGGFTTDSITVAPDTTTTYYVTYSDLFGETGLDSTKVTVFPTTQFSSFSFEAALNPGLPFDVTGEFSNDTISLHLPGGTNLQSLVASYSLTGGYISISINGAMQEPGVTPNDFTDPVIYTILAPGGTVSIWTVIADIETRNIEKNLQEVSIFPNPAKERIFIVNAEGWDFEMLNTIGKSVLTGTISEQDQTINLNAFKPGLYFLKFLNKDKVFVKRVVVSK